jgi:hypothetical protein
MLFMPQRRGKLNLLALESFPGLSQLAALGLELLELRPALGLPGFDLGSELSPIAVEGQPEL